MPLVVYCGAHLGYDPGRVPIGGGAAVGQALIRLWRKTKPFDLIVLGTGGEPPDPGVEYHRVQAASGQLLTDFSITKYAKFSRAFERGVLDFLTKLRGTVDPQDTVVLHNDIAEAGDFEKIGRMGFRQAAIFHVDVVDYVARIYLRGWVEAPRIARAWRFFSRLGLSTLMPDVLRLMFEKQEACARWVDLLVVPSTGMAEVLRRSYPWRNGEGIVVIPWGAWTEPKAGGIAQRVRALEAQYPKKNRPTLITLSRISPEKGQDLLLRALRVWEAQGGEPLLLFICGAPAYMHGTSYMRKLQGLAKRLRQTEVHFLGHVSGVHKQALFQYADLYVFPSRHESYGLTLMEAMAAGLPVLTTAHRSAPDVVRPEFGRVVAPTPEALCAGLAELLADRARLRARGRKAQEFARAHPFSRAADVLSQKLLAVILEKSHKSSGAISSSR